MSTDYVSQKTAHLYQEAGDRKPFLQLLWGDQVNVLEQRSHRSKVRARGVQGWIANEDLGGQPLLEVYFIDVGQGDGVLIRTPDDRHVLIDGGYNRTKQSTGKNAADFVDWKFVKDYGRKVITLDCVIASHCDADHYGGLWDLLEPSQAHELDAEKVEVKAFYHAGVAWWKKGSGRWLGPSEQGYLVQLMGNKADVLNALDPARPGPKLQGEWARFMKRVVENVPVVQRLNHVNGYVPGFSPNDGPASLKILGPVEHDVTGKPAVRDLGSDSQNTNGNSILLRLDYRSVRILLTGDLNAASQQVLLDEWQGQHEEFRCDVAKGCHHGSDDVSYAFLKAMEAAATIISSGDNERHAHPRPTIVAASATTGYQTIVGDKLETPLVFSTEIARSVDFGRITSIVDPDYPTQGGKISVTLNRKTGDKINYSQTRAGDLNPKKASRSIAGSYVVSGIVYGLVNVRTDGRTVLCATRNEADHSWEYKTFPSRFPQA